MKLARDIGAPELSAVDVPLVVDVDGTLIRTDILHESALKLASTRPFEALRIPLWLMRGKSVLKTEIAARVDLDIDTLPIDPDVLAFLEAEKARGRMIVLASASSQKFVEALAEHLGFVDRVLGTSASTNLSREKKRDALVEAFGEGGFDYIGNSDDDVPAWRAARRRYIVRGPLAPGLDVLKDGEPLELIAEHRVTLRTVVKALRLHQWAKNALLFVPIILGGAIDDGNAIVRTIAAFVGFGLLASATYLVNDLIDIPNDRKHWSKRNRPFASGKLPISWGIALVALGSFAGLGIGALLGLPAFLGLLGYAALTLAYSFRLKRVPILDASLLAGLYTWRLFVGVLVAGVALSPWLLVFSFAFFQSLSLAKRHTEITRMIATGKTSLAGRGYRTEDGPFIMSMGVASGISSVLIFVLYLIEGAFRAAYFTWPQALWACPVILMLWLCRVWLLCGRGELHDDPVEFAIRDRKSLILGTVAAGAVAASLVL